MATNDRAPDTAPENRTWIASGDATFLRIDERINALDAPSAAGVGNPLRTIDADALVADVRSRIEQAARHHLATAVTRRRQRAGLSVAALARHADLSASYIADIEAERANPSLRVVAALASALGCTVGEMWGERRGWWLVPPGMVSYLAGIWAATGAALVAVDAPVVGGVLLVGSVAALVIRAAVRR